MERFAEIDKIREQVLVEVARMALKGELRERVDELPYIIINREQPVYRCCVYHERAIVAERVRLAMGLDRRKKGERSRLSEEVETALALQRIEEPVVMVIESACDACPIDRFTVTNACRNCLAHACKNVCPREAIVIADKRAYIDQTRCIECGRCAAACPYHAIVEVIRPCIRACGVGAIQAYRDRKAKIDYRKCTSCGLCVRACPFGAISDKSEILQVIGMLKKGTPVYAAIAPSFVGQFGGKVTSGMLRTAFRQLGFKDLVEVALGADLVTWEESQEFIQGMQEGKPFMMNTCCSAFTELVRKHYPDLAKYQFKSVSPMVRVAQWLKKKEPGAKVVFVGPCIAKKLEALRLPARKYVDAVLTFDEVRALFKAAEIELSAVTPAEELQDASRSGRIFGRAGGVTEALIGTIKRINPEIGVEPERAEGLAECSKLLKAAEAGRLRGNLIEGMACPGGCVGGPATWLKEMAASKLVENFSQKAEYAGVPDNPVVKSQLKPPR